MTSPKFYAQTIQRKKQTNPHQIWLMTTLAKIHVPPELTSIFGKFKMQNIYHFIAIYPSCNIAELST